MPQASMSESISAPRAAPKPRSTQRATICTCGIAIATQQAMPAKARMACNTFGGRPSGRAGAASAMPAGLGGGSGARRRRAKASGSITMRQVAPITRCAWRQPMVEMPHCSSGGHRVPAK